MPIDWKAYQEKAAAFFRSLGLDAQTDVRLKGVRTHHDVDVVVQLHYVGFNVTWLVECKHWQKPVSKLHVLGLREIVTDVGADRGIILSEAGFQRGALEAAALTSVHPTSLAALRQTARTDIFAMRLRELYDRTEACKKRYWNIPKAERIRLGLRPDATASGYSGASVIGLAEELLVKAFRSAYPIKCDGLYALSILRGPCTFATAKDVLAVLEPLIEELEKRLKRRVPPRKRSTR